MNRMLTAAVALTAALGMAGLAHAQSNTNMNAPSGAQNPSTMGTTRSTGTMQSPTPSQGQMNQAQTAAPASRSEIQQAQEQLKSQGLYRGAVDGVMGPETQTALMAFQREHSLPQTSQLDQRTMDALNGNGSNAGGMRQPGAASMQPGGGNAPAPAGNMNGAPGTTPGGTITR